MAPVPGSRFTPEELIIGAAEHVMKKVYEPWFQAQFARWQAASDAAALSRGIAQLRASSMMIGMSGLVLTLVVPLAVWVGVWAAMGAPYMQAKALVKQKAFTSGFSQGFVMRLLNWDWRHVVARFFMFSAGQINPFDESLSYAAANAYNEGLRAGYVQASFLARKTQAAFLSKLRSLSPLSRAGVWDRLDQISYVIDLAGAGVRNGMFVSDD